tara:strand:+ start:203 stop:667 length:465 start_codon:yes stop_codon:yes gene_type:complete
MKKLMRIIGKLFFASLIIASCSNEAKNCLEDVLEITGNNFRGSCKVGGASGNAAITVDGGSAKVSYSAMGYSATERGVLENLELKDGGKGNTYRIVGDWNNKDAGDGSFYLEVYGADKPNTVYLAIKGGSWMYFCNMKLSDDDFNKFIAILSIQ